MNRIKVKLLNKMEMTDDKYLSNITKITYSEKLNEKQDIAEQLLDIKSSNTKIVENVVKFNHTSILEHLNYTFLVEGASRSFLAQVTRHRHFSFTSGSQHYIDYSKIADFVIPIEMLEISDENLKTKTISKYLDTNSKSLEKYRDLISDGIKPEVARQVLPNGMRNNLVITGNLRQFINFLNQRLCFRNTSEIQYIAYKIYRELYKLNPEIMKQVGPDCMIRGFCTQGHKTCGRGKIKIEDIENRFKLLIEEEL